jgi:SAM-dependent methyltransferase/DNA-directed RNA polymerase subunit RPC12/RpoP
MHEVLRNLHPESFVLDLGCAQGSFSSHCTRAKIVRLDRVVPDSPLDGFVVQGDAKQLPFACHTFAAVIANHSLEHIDDLVGSLIEIGRVLRRDGCLFASVPDASTFTDKLYRWLSRGGGHVNGFTSAGDLAKTIERCTGLPFVATRTLCSSLSFLNARNSHRPRPRRLLLLGGGGEWSLFAYVWLSRRIDRKLNLRTSIYGWALYFGAIPEAVNTEMMMNVCIRCGSGFTASCLKQSWLVHSNWIGARLYRCPDCGATNPLID